MTSTTPPGIPNTFETAINMGEFGTIDPVTHRYKSVYLPQQMLVAGALDDVYYKITSSLPTGYLRLKTREYPEFSSWVEVFDGNRASKGSTRGEPDSDRTGIQINSGTTYLDVKRDPGDANPKYDLGFYVVPANDANYVDRDRGGVDHLGTLTTSLTRSDTLFTFYERDLAGSTAGSMQILSNKKVDDAKDTMSFTLAQAGTVTITTGGTFGAFVLEAPPQGNVGHTTLTRIAGEKTLNLQAGTYKLHVYDSATQVSVGAQVTAFRPDWEHFDRYSVTVTLKGQPDLVAAMSNLSATTASPGQTVTANYTISSFFAPSGGGAVGVYLSADPTVTTADRLLTKAYALQVIASSQDFATTVALPADLAPGTYYIGVVADCEGSVSERNEANNASGSIAITVLGGSGDGIIEGVGARNEIFPLSGSTTALGVKGNAGTDFLWAGSGADRLWGGADRDILVGGDGNDALVGDDVAASLAGAPDQLLGGRGRDVMSGGAGGDYLHGEWDNDRVFGNAGNDLLYGGFGADSLDGGGGDDQLFGATEARPRGDWFGGAILVEWNGATGRAAAPQHWTIAGEAQATDTGNDVLSGGAGNDQLFGQRGNDTLSGGNGRDLLVGGYGRDVMAGGAGADVFDFDAVTDTSLAAQDVVTFVRADGDRIDLRTIDANATLSGNQSFAWANAADLDAPFTGRPGQLRFAAGLLQGDVTGDGRPDFAIQVVGALAAADVLL